MLQRVYEGTPDPEFRRAVRVPQTAPIGATEPIFSGGWSGSFPGIIRGGRRYQTSCIPPQIPSPSQEPATSQETSHDSARPAPLSAQEQVRIPACLFQKPDAFRTMLPGLHHRAGGTGPPTLRRTSLLKCFRICKTAIVAHRESDGAYSDTERRKGFDLCCDGHPANYPFLIDRPEGAHGAHQHTER